MKQDMNSKPAVRRGLRETLAAMSDADRHAKSLAACRFVTGSAEFEHMFTPEWVAAVFVDAGDAFTSRDFRARAGIGAGVRCEAPEVSAALADASARSTALAQAAPGIADQATQAGVNFVQAAYPVHSTWIPQ